MFSNRKRRLSGGPVMAVAKRGLRRRHEHGAFATGVRRVACRKTPLRRTRLRENSVDFAPYKPDREQQSCDESQHSKEAGDRTEGHGRDARATTEKKTPQNMRFCETNPNVICEKQGISGCCE